jgi:hypothetical protein
MAAITFAILYGLKVSYRFSPCDKKRQLYKHMNSRNRNIGDWSYLKDYPPQLLLL